MDRQPDDKIVKEYQEALTRMAFKSLYIDVLKKGLKILVTDISDSGAVELITYKDVDSHYSVLSKMVYNYYSLSSYFSAVMAPDVFDKNERLIWARLMWAGPGIFGGSR